MDLTCRAYSRIEVKSINGDRRIIRGVATTPAVDRVDDIVEPLGVRFKNPLPLLWQHNHSKPIGLVKFETPTADGIPFEAELPVVKEDGILRDRVEEAWQSMEYGLVRAVSIGFRAIEYSYMENGGVHFLETEVFELSAVTIPANEQAIITSVGKSLNAEAIACIKRFEFPADEKPAPAALGKKVHVARLAKEARDRAPFTIKTIHRI